MGGSFAMGGLPVVPVVVCSVAPGAIPTPTLRLKLGATQENPMALSFSTRSSVSCDFKPRNRNEYSLRCFMTHRPKALSAG